MTDKTPLSNDEALKRIRDIFQNGKVVSTQHIRKDSMAERNFDLEDVKNVIMHGLIEAKPEYDETRGNWKYPVKGQDLDGDELTIIVALVPENYTIILITGM